jgi:hypothetical protein
MLDNVGLELSSVTLDEYNQIIKNLQVERPEDSDKMKVYWYNMQIVYFPKCQKLLIQNSLHKLFNLITKNVNSNSNDFGLADLNMLSGWFSNVYFNRPLEDFRISRRFEFGLNVSTGNKKAIDIVNLWLSFKMNPFYVVPPLKKGQKPLQRTCYFCDYKVKIYDKLKQEKACEINNKNILRYEIAVEQLRKLESILGIKNISLKSVNEHEVWVKLYFYLLDVYDSIAKIPLIDERIPIEDIYTSYSYMDSIMAKTIKNNVKENSFKRMRERAKNVFLKYDMDNSNVHNILRLKIQNKFIDLCN